MHDVIVQIVLDLGRARLISVGTFNAALALVARYNVFLVAPIHRSVVRQTQEGALSSMFVVLVRDRVAGGSERFPIALLRPCVIVVQQVAALVDAPFAVLVNVAAG